MTTDEILKEQEPYSTDGGVVVYEYQQVKKMLMDISEQSASDWFKQEMAANEEFRTLVTRELIIALRYCLPMPPINASFDEFRREYGWNQNVSNDTAEMLVRLIATGDRHKQVKPFGNDQEN